MSWDRDPCGALRATEVETDRGVHASTTKRERGGGFSARRRVIQDEKERLCVCVC